MKIEKQIAVFSIVLLAVLSAQAQGTFANLKFELAHPISAGNPEYPSFVTAASALPYWTVTIGGVQQTEISFNAPSTGSPAVVLIGPGNNFGLAPIDGNYSVFLQGSGVPSAASISQTGLIPAGMQSLLFEAQPGTGPLDISIGGQNIPFTAVGTGVNYTLYGANISAWAGDSEGLTFSALEGSLGLNNWEIDDISFSTTPEPEPSIVTLTAIGGLLFGARKWFARH